jgi:hypothetical protein
MISTYAKEIRFFMGKKNGSIRQISKEKKFPNRQIFYDSSRN